MKNTPRLSPKDIEFAEQIARCAYRQWIDAGENYVFHPDSNALTAHEISEPPPHILRWLLLPTGQWDPNEGRPELFMERVYRAILLHHIKTARAAIATNQATPLTDSGAARLIQIHAIEEAEQRAMAAFEQFVEKLKQPPSGRSCGRHDGPVR